MISCSHSDNSSGIYDLYEDRRERPQRRIRDLDRSDRPSSGSG